MRRLFAAFLSLSMLLSAAALAAADRQMMDREQEDFLLSSLAGVYQVIGRFPDSRKTYAGEMKIERKGNKLILERKINGVKAAGEASVQTATADKVPVIRAVWKQGKTEYGATYQVQMDLDNYPRLTGYVYRTGKGAATANPGLEALFSCESQMDKN